MMKVLLLLAVAGICAADFNTNSVKSVVQNYNEEINNLIQQQITAELRASYMYQAYGHYFNRADVALPGFAKWFEKAAIEERSHASGLIDYVNQRGGVVTLNDIQFSAACSTISSDLFTYFPQRKVACICYFMSQKKDKLKDEECMGDKADWSSALWAMQDTLILERYVNAQLLALHQAADANKDAHFTHILEHVYLDEQVSSIKSIGDIVRQLERVGDGLGVYMIDQNL